MSDGSQYDADYFLRGKETGKSLYEDYRWMPEMTLPMCEAIIKHLGVKRGDSLLDFGCARGYTVRAMRDLGVCAFGYDVSLWAINNADIMAHRYLTGLHSTAFSHKLAYDWVVAKDVLEHVPDLSSTTINIMEAARRGVFVVVPLGYGEDGYEVPEYDLDVTHIHRLSLQTWAGKFMRPGWSVEARYRLCGVKDNYAGWPTGNGFVTCRRVEG